MKLHGAPEVSFSFKPCPGTGRRCWIPASAGMTSNSSPMIPMSLSQQPWSTGQALPSISDAFSFFAFSEVKSAFSSEKFLPPTCEDFWCCADGKPGEQFLCQTPLCRLGVKFGSFLPAGRIQNMQYNWNKIVSHLRVIEHNCALFESISANSIRAFGLSCFVSNLQK